MSAFWRRIRIFIANRLVDLSKNWTVHKLSGDEPHAYAVYVDDKGKVWVTDFGANAILSFDPKSEAFESFPSNKPDAAVRQLNGRAGEVWGAESGADRLVMIRAATVALCYGRARSG